MSTSAASARSSADSSVLQQAALVLAALIGEYSLLIMPFVLTAMMQAAQISESRAAQFVSIQLLAMAFASIVVSLRLRAGQSVRALLAIAVIAISAANALCALQVTPIVLAGARVLTGLGEGTVMAAAAAVVCGTAAPHRLYSLIGMAVAVVAALALVITPWLISIAGVHSIFWLLAMVPLLLLPLITRVPAIASAGEVPTGTMVRSARLASAAVLVAFMLLWAGGSALWVFAERIGAHQGLTGAQIGLWLGIGQLAGVAGPIAAAWGAPRWGLRGSLVAGCIGMAIAALCFTLGERAWLYGVGGCLASFWIMFVVPCFRSHMAAIDTSGRTVAASAAFYTIGFGVAPAIVAALTTEGGGYIIVTVFSVACFLASAALASSARQA